MFLFHSCYFCTQYSEIKTDSAKITSIFREHWAPDGCPNILFISNPNIIYLCPVYSGILTGTLAFSQKIDIYVENYQIQKENE